MQSVFFWEFPRRLKFKSRRFGTQCRFHRPGRSGMNRTEKEAGDRMRRGTREREGSADEVRGI